MKCSFSRPLTNPLAPTMRRGLKSYCTLTRIVEGRYRCRPSWSAEEAVTCSIPTSARPCGSPAGLALIALVLAACGGAGASSPPAGTTAPSAASETTAPATPGASGVPPDQVTGDLTVLDWAGYDDRCTGRTSRTPTPTSTSTSSSATSDADILARWRPAARPTSSTPTPAGSSSTSTRAWPPRSTRASSRTGTRCRRRSRRSARSTASSTSSRGTGASPRSSTTPTRSTPSPAGRPCSIRPYTDHISMWDDGPGAVTVSSYIHGWDETAITD